MGLFSKGDPDYDLDDPASWDDRERGESWAARPGARTDGELAAIARRQPSRWSREGRHQQRLNRWARGKKD